MRILSDFAKRTPVLSLCFAFASCGGGGGASNASEEAAAAPIPTAAAANVATTTGVTTAVNKDLIPASSPGYSELRITQTTRQPYRDNDGVGAFRTVCDYSHFKFDDPLVYPSQAGKSHLHLFFGNSLTDANSTVETLKTTGNSTCRGGIANRSGYWVPAMIDTDTGTPLLPGSSSDSHGIDVYYKTGYHGVQNSQVKPIPPGFRMIAGNSKSVVSQDRSGYACENVGTWTLAMPSCSPGTWLFTRVEFPQCWDGVNLDSPDHKSHVANAANGRGCDDPRYPVALPEVTYIVKYLVPAKGNRSWRLSSDINGAPAGSSAHADYVFGWQDNILPVAVSNIINKGLSGGSDLIGDGRDMY